MPNWIIALPKELEQRIEAEEVITIDGGKTLKFMDEAGKTVGLVTTGTGVTVRRADAKVSRLDELSDEELETMIRSHSIKPESS
jgi:hypothetical protein